MNGRDVAKNYAPSSGRMKYQVSIPYPACSRWR